jgi:transposase
VLAVAERFKVTFQDGYAPPPEELRQLVAAIEAKVWEVCRKRPAHNRMPERVEDYAFALYQQGLDRSRMKRALESHADTDISGRDWANLRTVMKRICEERGVEYAPSRIDRSNLPYETRELMLDLYRQLRGWAVVGDELNRLGISRPGGGEWRSDSVRLTLLRHAEHQGLSLQKPKGAQRKGRPSHLSGAMRQRLWEMHYDEAMSYIAIARWLNERGIKTASGKAPWNKPTVMYTVQVVNRERKQLARKRAA